MIALATVLLVSMGGVEKQGLGLLLALLTGGGFLAATNLHLPFTGYLACIGLWGVCGGFAMSLARSIVQESAPDEYRARAMSIYSLGSLGGAPVGALLLGWLTGVVGPLQTYLVAVAGVAATVAVVWMTSAVAGVNRLGHETGQGRA